MSDTFEVRLQRLEGFRFRTDWGLEGLEPLIVDEPPPLGQSAGPNPARLLAAAVGDCLSASLVFCLGRSRVEVAGVDTRVSGTYVRNERKRMRIGRLEVTLTLDTPGSEPEALSKCLGMFEDFCVVTASVRQGIPVAVRVVDPRGRELFSNPGD